MTHPAHPDDLDPTPRVAVLGAGPVGQTAALLLARWGVPVVLLDRRPARDAAGSRAICQQRDVLDVWEAVGAGARIAAEGVTWTTARTYHRERELFAQTFTDRGRSPFPPWVNISQSRTEQVLDERLAGQPLVDVRWSHEVVALSQDGEGVTLTCRTPDGEVPVGCSYVVACAGARADALRTALGVSFDGRSFADQFLICDIRASLPGWETERRFSFDPVWNPGRQVLVHACPDSTYRIDWQVPPDFDLAAETASGRLDERVRAVVGEAPYEVVWKSQYRFHSRCASRLRVGRVLLAGDCAHVVAPFGARGLNSGVQDAENAAWKLAFVLRGWAGDALLDSYHDERYAAAQENLDVTSATMRFLVPQTDEERRRRQAVLEAAPYDPAMRSQVDSGRLAEPFWYVDSPLTTVDSSRPFAGRPPKGETPPAAPGVLVPDVPVTVPGQPDVTRLRSLVRNGLLVLLAGAGDAARVAAVAKEAVGAPTRVLSAGELSPDGSLAAALSARPDEAWVVRPDGHVAAVLAAGDEAGIGAALRRSLALPVPV